MLNRTLQQLTVASLLLVGSAAHAATVTVDAVGNDRGAFNSSGFVQMFSTDWKTPEGIFWVRSLGNGSANEVTRLYHIFDIPALTAGQVIESATLLIPHSNRSYASTNGSAGAGDPTETVALFDVSTSADTLRNPDESQGISVLDAIFGDLGSGTTYGSFVASAASNGTTEMITLNADAIAALNAAAGGEWAVGGALQSANLTVFGAEEQVFKGSEDSPYPFTTASQLELTVVPLPPALALFASALVGLGLFGGRARRGQS